MWRWNIKATSPARCNFEIMRPTEFWNCGTFACWNRGSPGCFHSWALHDQLVLIVHSDFASNGLLNKHTHNVIDAMMNTWFDVRLQSTLNGCHPKKNAGLRGKSSWSVGWNATTNWKLCARLILEMCVFSRKTYVGLTLQNHWRWKSSHQTQWGIGLTRSEHAWEPSKYNSWCVAVKMVAAMINLVLHSGWCS